MSLAIATSCAEPDQPFRTLSDLAKGVVALRDRLYGPVDLKARPAHLARPSGEGPATVVRTDDELERLVCYIIMPGAPTLDRTRIVIAAIDAAESRGPL